MGAHLRTGVACPRQAANQSFTVLAEIESLTLPDRFRLTTGPDQAFDPIVRVGKSAVNQPDNPLANYQPPSICAFQPNLIGMVLVSSGCCGKHWRKGQREDRKGREINPPLLRVRILRFVCVHASECVCSSKASADESCLRRQDKRHHDTRHILEE
ncbi:hypothetical protein NQZ68_020963 [Dissostichus eleginoides]|nr:hypothetical protein NQZ68_020963 [Dissostichus eleginoides]